MAKDRTTEEQLDNTIKGRIAETISEEMFRELGFFVLRTGQEHTVNPIIQMSDIVPRCGGKFYFNYGKNYNYVRKFPDFIIVKSGFEPALVEVKFRSDGKIEDEDKEVFSIFPGAFLLVMHTGVGKRFLDNLPSIKYNPTDLLNSNIHVWEDEKTPHILSFWLKTKFGINETESGHIIDKYTKKIIKWIPKNELNKKKIG